MTEIWTELRAQAKKLAEEEPLLATHIHSIIISTDSLPAAVGRLLAEKLATEGVSSAALQQTYNTFAQADTGLEQKIIRDIQAVLKNDPAAHDTVTPFLFFKGFHALQGYRLAHHLWTNGKPALALFIQNRLSELFAVDIHPAARIGSGIMMDHATGIVIGETSIVEDNVLFWHHVTLGGRTLNKGDRHPKVRTGVHLGAGCTLIGNIEIGEGARIGACSVVLEDIPPRVTAVGVPAVIIGKV